MKKQISKFIILLTIIIITLCSSCLEKSVKHHLHKFSGVWEIEQLDRCIRNPESFEIETSYHNIGFVELYDNNSDIGKYNNSVIKADTSVHSVFVRNLTGSHSNIYNPAYWYSDDMQRLTLWNQTSFNYITFDNYSTFTVEIKSKNKHIWTFYYHQNDSTGMISPYLDPTHKEVLYVRRKSH